MSETLGRLAEKLDNGGALDSKVLSRCVQQAMAMEQLFAEYSGIDVPDGQRLSASLKYIQAGYVWTIEDLRVAQKWALRMEKVTTNLAQAQSTPSP